MKWVTREHAKVDRIACPWLIRRFIDPTAEFLFVPADQVLAVAEREGAHSYDTPGAKYTHRGGKCSFEALVEDYHLNDAALGLMAKVVHGADVPADITICPEAAGLNAIADGFSRTTPDDHEKIRLETPLYDALYAWCANKVGAPPS